MLLKRRPGLIIAGPSALIFHFKLGMVPTTRPPVL